MEQKNLKLIGTSHIAKQSINEVRAAVDSFKPDIIALELDRARYRAMLSKKRKRLSLYSINKIGLKGFFFAVIGSWVSNKLGKIVKVKPGTEMVTAIRFAKQKGLKIALIDQNIQITLYRFSKSISFKEKINFIVDMFKAIFFRKSVQRELGIKKLDLSKVPSDKLIKLLLKRVQLRYPNMYRVLVEERNRVMANNLIHIAKQNPEKRILAVVGAGHLEGINELIKEQPVTYSYTVS